MSRYHSLMEVTIDITDNLRESFKTATAMLDSKVEENYVSLDWVKKEKIEWDIKKHLYELYEANRQDLESVTTEIWIFSMIINSHEKEIYFNIIKRL